MTGSFRSVLSSLSSQLLYFSIDSACFNGLIDHDHLSILFPELLELCLTRVDLHIMSILPVIGHTKLEVLTIQGLPRPEEDPTIASPMTLADENLRNVRHLVLDSGRIALYNFVAANITSLTLTMDRLHCMTRLMFDVVTENWSALRSLTITPAIVRGQTSVSREDAEFIAALVINNGWTGKILEIGPLEDDTVLDREDWNRLREQMEVIVLGEEDTEVDRVLARMKAHDRSQVATSGHSLRD